MSIAAAALMSNKNLFDKLLTRLFHESSLSSNIRAIKKDTYQVIMPMPSGTPLITDSETTAIEHEIRQKYELVGDQYTVTIEWIDDDQGTPFQALKVQRITPP